jgi:hypothetical protein
VDTRWRTARRSPARSDPLDRRWRARATPQMPPAMAFNMSRVAACTSRAQRGSPGAQADNVCDRAVRRVVPDRGDGRITLRGPQLTDRSGRVQIEPAHREAGPQTGSASAPARPADEGPRLAWRPTSDPAAALRCADSASLIVASLHQRVGRRAAPLHAPGRRRIA